MFKKNKKNEKELEELFEQEEYIAPTKKELRREKKYKLPDEAVSQHTTVTYEKPVKAKILYQKQEPYTPPKQEPAPVESPKKEKTTDKAELSEYFKENKKQAKKVKKKPEKPERFDDSKLSKKERKRQLEMDLYEGRALKYKDQIFRDVPQLLDYLRKNYLLIDKIAKDLFDQKAFHEWLKTHSNQYGSSMVEFEEIVAKIENN